MIQPSSRKVTVSDRRRRRAISLAATLATVVLGGCTSLTQPINGVPANRLPPQFFAPPKNNLVPVDISLLSSEPPREYQIDKGDILGVYVEGVLPFNPPNVTPEPPPVNFPEADSSLPPSIGFPIAVQEDGTLSLPLIEPVEVRGLTLDQVREKIRDAYIDSDILRPEKARPIVSLIKERTYNIIVVREDGAGSGGAGTAVAARGSSGGAIRGTSDQSGTGSLIKLPAYQNDILHALVETGGLPGINAKNEVKILRASLADQRKRAEFLQQFYAQQQAAMLDPCSCPPELPEDPSILRIPLRLPPGVVPQLKPSDVILEDGDIVYIETRETEVFYTGGLLPGGEFQLPRDYDLDVLGAISIAGGSIGSTAGQGGGAGGFGPQQFSQLPPGKVYILRKTRCNGQVAIEVSLSGAINDPRQRPLIQPGDIVILRYSCEEETLNLGLSTFFTFGVAQLFNGRN